jgi:Arc/MetJ family transcription regulator
MMQNEYLCGMRITVNLDEETLKQVQAMTGERQKSRAVARAIDELVRRKQAREFGRLIREGAFDYPMTNDEIEAADR